jgi:hypothetical protein
MYLYMKTISVLSDLWGKLTCFVFASKTQKNSRERKSVFARVCFLSVVSKKVKRERIFTHKNAHSEKKKRTLFAVDRKKKEMDARKIY